MQKFHSSLGINQVLSEQSRQDTWLGLCCKVEGTGSWSVVILSVLYLSVRFQFVLFLRSKFNRKLAYVTPSLELTWILQSTNIIKCMELMLGFLIHVQPQAGTVTSHSKQDLADRTHWRLFHGAVVLHSPSRSNLITWSLGSKSRRVRKYVVFNPIIHFEDGAKGPHKDPGALQEQKGKKGIPPTGPQRMLLCQLSLLRLMYNIWATECMVHLHSVKSLHS